MQRAARGLVVFMLVCLLVPLASVQQVRAATVTATNFTDPAPGACATSGTGTCSLREAVIFANMNPGMAVNLLAGTYVLTRGTASSVTDGTTGSLKVSGTLSITGTGADMTIIDAGGMPTGQGDRILFVQSSGAVVMTGVTLRNANLSSYGDVGGAAASAGRLTLNECMVTGNSTSSGDGGPLYNSGPQAIMAITHSVITGNHTPTTSGSVEYGGAIVSRDSVSLTITDSVISGNSADFGGGIDNESGALTVTNSTVSGNTATYDGGGIINWDIGVIDNSVVENNTAGQEGGGVFDASSSSHSTLRNHTVVRGNIAGMGGGGYFSFGNATVSDSTFSANRAGGGGGGIANAGTLTITASTIGGAGADGNVATHEGGGIRGAGTVHATGIVVTGNTVTDPQSSHGGGIFFRFGTMTLDGSSVTANSARDGAGMYVESDGGVTVTASSIAANTAQNGNGAGIYVVGRLMFIGSTVSGNSANGGEAGGIYNNGITSVTNATISGNTHTAANGGDFYNANQLTLTNATIANNITGLHNIGSATVVTIRNSILANAGTNCLGGITSGGFNLSSDTSCAALTQSRDLQNVDPRLGPLADNGGPTKTHALLSGSPAIDAGGTGANGCPATDQRGITRPQGAACDIGAYEFARSPTPRPGPVLTGSATVIPPVRPGPITAGSTPIPLPASR